MRRAALAVAVLALVTGTTPAVGRGCRCRATGWVSIRGVDVPSTGRLSFRAPSGGLHRVVVVRSGWATATGSRLRLA